MRVGNISGEFSLISWPKPFEFGRPRRVLIPDKPRISRGATALRINAHHESKGDRIRAAFVRMFDADPRKLDTMDGKPVQRSDIAIAHQNRSPEELSDEELADAHR